MEEVYECLRVYYHYKGPGPQIEEAAPTAEKPAEKPQDPWKPNTPLGVRILRTVELHAQKPAIYYLREAPSKGLELVTVKWDDLGIMVTRYAKCLYALLRPLITRHHHAGRPMFVVPIVTTTASVDSISLYLASLLIGAVPIFVWGANNRVTAALRSIAPAVLFIEGEALHHQLKQAGIPPGVSKLILFGAISANPLPASPVPTPTLSASPPASPVGGGMMTLLWKNFLDAGDRLREPTSLLPAAADEDAPCIAVLSVNYWRAALLSTRAVMSAAHSVATALNVADTDSTLTAAPLSHASQLLFSVFIPQLTGCATYLVPEWKTFLNRPSLSVPSVFSLPARLWERLVRWLQAHLGTGVAAPARTVQWQVGIRAVAGFPGARLAVSFASLLTQTATTFICSHLGIQLADLYGTAESAGALSLRYPCAPSDTGSLQPLQGVEYTLKGHDMSVRSTSLCLGLLFPEAQPARVDGWLVTGDAAEDLGGGKLRLLGPIRDGLPVQGEISLAGLREHLLVEDAALAEGGAGVVIALDPMILLSMAINIGCAPDLLRTAPFLRSLVQQHAVSVFGRLKMSVPEIILFPRGVAPNDVLPSLAIDIASLTSAVASEITSIAARQAASRKLEEDKDTPALARSRRLFNVQRMQAQRAAAAQLASKKEKEEKKDKDRDGIRDSKERSRDKKKDTGARKERPREHKLEKRDSKEKEKEKDKGPERREMHRGDRDSKEKDAADKKEAPPRDEKDKGPERRESQNEEKLKGPEKRDTHRADKDRESKEKKDDGHHERRDSARGGVSTSGGSMSSAKPGSQIGGVGAMSNSQEKLMASAPAGAVRLDTSQQIAALPTTSTSARSVSTTPSKLTRRDTMTIMALEMSSAPALTTLPSAHAKSKGPKGKEAFTEADMQTWLEEVLGTKIFQEGVSSSETLKDGIVLCKLMQALRPGSVRKYNQMKGAFFQLENISFFLAACTQHMGLAKTDLFDVRDLYDQSNFVKVLHTLELVNRAAKPGAAATVASHAPPHVK